MRFLQHLRLLHCFSHTQRARTKTVKVKKRREMHRFLKMSSSLESEPARGTFAGSIRLCREGESDAKCQMEWARFTPLARRLHSESGKAWEEHARASRLSLFCPFLDLIFELRTSQAVVTTALWIGRVCVCVVLLAFHQNRPTWTLLLSSVFLLLLLLFSFRNKNLSIGTNCINTHELQQASLLRRLTNQPTSDSARVRRL